MIVSINQPAYLPWLGYFDRINCSDIHVVLDHVQFEKNSMVNRNKIWSQTGWTWLTVPVSTKGRFGNLSIQDIQISKGQPWIKKHLGTLRQCYSKSSYFSDYYPEIEKILQHSDESFFSLLDRQFKFLLEALQINKTKIVYSSDLELNSSKSDLVLECCTRLGASKYLSGPFGRDYLQMDDFISAGIEVVFCDYEHPVYCQRHSGFEPFLSVLDLLFNHGPNSLSILNTSKWADK